MYRILVLEGVVKCQNVKSCFLNLRSIGRLDKKAAPDVLPKVHASCPHVIPGDRLPYVGKSVSGHDHNRL